MLTFSTNSTLRADALDAFFKAHPAATLVVTKFGHAYARAKHTSTCKLTRTEIRPGMAIRRITVATRSGREVEVTVANEIFGILFGARDVRIDFTTGRIDGFVSTFTRFTGTDLLDDLAALNPGGRARLTLVDRFGRTREFVRGASGRWGGKRSTAALIGSLRRSRNYRLIKVEAEVEMGRFAIPTFQSVALAAG